MDDKIIQSELIGGISVEEAERMGFLNDDLEGEPLLDDEQEGGSDGW